MLFYLSFASDEKGGFLGAAVIEADSLMQAVENSNHLGINPGGEVVAYDVTAFECPYPKNVLMSADDMALIDGGPGKRLGDMSEDERAACERYQTGMVHESCNDALRVADPGPTDPVANTR
jgi:hypothetical protein